MTKRSATDIVIVLGHELACALEMNFQPHEMKQLWPEALSGLQAAADYLKEQNLPVPSVIQNVLTRTKEV